MGEVKGTKLPGHILASALKISGLRLYLPSRQNTHKLSDAAEALIGYAWLMGKIKIKEVASSIASFIDPNISLKDNTQNVISAFSSLLNKIMDELVMGELEFK